MTGILTPKSIATKEHYRIMWNIIYIMYYIIYIIYNVILYIYVCVLNIYICYIWNIETPKNSLPQILHTKTGDEPVATSVSSCVCKV
jgi:heme/copper-type cytochrome/quinol oxidase subunit 2